MTDPCVQVLLEAIGGYLLILNSHRQILAANRDLLEALHRESPEHLVGLRPGEAFNCVHFTDGPDGCGTAKHCRSCGAAISILASQKRQARVSEECRLSTLVEGKLAARDFRVTASPLMIQGEQLTAVVMVDISAEKRRDILERTFLHDVANSLGGIDGWSQLMKQLEPEVAAREILALAEAVKAEVFSHRALIGAERGELTAQMQACGTQEIMEALDGLFRTHPVREGRNLELIADTNSAKVWTDKGLLLRVLTNMLKNAFEASNQGGTVRLWFELRAEGPTFVVENPGTIPEAIQPHIFERSFSTKADQGRGLGTYSMKLFGERYLQGTVSYDSVGGVTRFWIVLPRERARHTNSLAPGHSAEPPGTPILTAKPTLRVLLVEDDEAVLRLSSLFLKRLGYGVVTCRHGVEAESVFQACPADFVAVITDQLMPEMDGLTLSRRLHAIRKDIPILLCTGDEAALTDTQSRGQNDICAVILKPFSLPILSDALRRFVPSLRQASDVNRP
jgi:hypothetical protein